MPIARTAYSGILACLLLVAANGNARAGSVDAMREFDQAAAALGQEIANQTENVAKMQQILDDYAAGQGPAPRAGQLKPMGQAGVGVVGAGHGKHPAVQAFIKEFESLANPQNLTGGAKFLNDIAGERNKLIPKRKQELGLGPNDELPEAEERKIQDIAVGVAHFKVEVVRSGQAIARMRTKIAEINHERTTLLASMTEEEKEAYKTQGTAAPPDRPAEVGESVPPPGARNDPALIARLDKSFVKLQFAMTSMERDIARDRQECKRIADAVETDGPENIKRRVKTLEDSIAKLAGDMRPTAFDDQVAEWRSLLAALERVVRQVDQARDGACATSRASPPNLDDIKADVLKGRNLGAIANRIAVEARGVVRGLLDRIGGSTIDREAYEKSIRDLQSEIGTVNDLCVDTLVFRPDADDRTRRLEEPRSEILAALQEAAGGKLTPERRAAYSDKLNDYAARMNSSIGSTDYAACRWDRKLALVDCFGLAERPGVGLEVKITEGLSDSVGELRRNVDEYFEDVPARRTKAERVLEEAPQIDSLWLKVLKANADARQCLADAESGKPAIDPKLLGEAGDLGSPSKAACNSTDLRGRAARLRDPKYAAVPGVKDMAAELERLAGIYDVAKSHFDKAKAAYDKADFPLIHAELDQAQAQVDAMAAKVDCSSFKQTIAQGRDRAERLAKAIQRAEETLRQCEPDTLRAHVQALDDKTKHPVLTASKQRMQRQLAGLDRFNAANDTYKAGNLNAARDQLTAIKASLAGAPPDDCPALRKKIDSGLERIETVRRLAAQVDAMTRDCDLDRIKRFSAELPDGDQATLKQMRGRLDAALKSCPRAKQKPPTTDIARAHGECKGKLGTHGIAVHAPDRLSGYRCDCESPYRLEGSACIEPRTESETAAARDARCGAGHRAGPVDASGSFYCLPTRDTANAACQRDFGTGYSVGQIRSDGTFYCVPDKQTADAWCWEKNGPGSLAGTINPDGTHTCVAGSVLADARCQQANPGKPDVYAGPIQADGSFNCFQMQQPGQGANDAAAAAAAAALMNGIGAMLNQRSSRPPATGGAWRGKNCRLDAFGPSYIECMRR